MVDERPGTTRDAIDIQIERDGRSSSARRYRRHPAKGQGHQRGQRARRCQRLSGHPRHGALRRRGLLCDAEAGVAEQDAKILGLAVDRGRAVVIGLNKTDLLDDTQRKGARGEERATS